MFEDGNAGVVRLKDLSIACGCPTPTNAVHLPSYALMRESFRASILGADDDVDAQVRIEIGTLSQSSGASRE